MGARISKGLLQWLREAEQTEPQREIPVIVTTVANADLTELEQKGLKIQRRFENIPAVCGTICAADVKQVAQLDQVEIIEEDGEVWALSADDQ